MRGAAESMGADAAECEQPSSSPPPSAVNARVPGDILTITAAAATGEFSVCTQFMITMAISGRHGHAPVVGVIRMEFGPLLLVVCVMIGVVLMDGFVVRFCGVLLLAMILPVLFCRRRVRLCAVGALAVRWILRLLVSLI